MCGIAGILTVGDDLVQTIVRVQCMTDVQYHRGPDDQDVQVISEAHPTLILGHRRLSIIDLSAAGHQPMRDAATGNTLVFNGEIYNFRHLRDELMQQGQTFCSQTDTEVILKAYSVWGTSCVARLRGIFAFALWDCQQQRLLLARDQIGVKPLYFYKNDGTLLFASEVRALLASGLIPRRLDSSGFHSYLRYGSVQEPHALIKDVYSLAPGHILSWQSGKIETRCYWQLPTPESILSQPPDDVYEQIQVKLTEAVAAQLVADVPLGAFLSGGIDSTAIAALMQQQTGTVKTFSIIFDEADYDERTYARIAAKHIGTDHNELLLDSHMIRNQLDNALNAFDQPSMDGLNTYFVAKVTREAGLTVALSGVGGDELFGGYAGYNKPLMLERWHRRLGYIPKPIRQLMVGLSCLTAQTEAIRRGADLLSTMSHPYALARQVFNERQIAQLLTRDWMGDNMTMDGNWQQRMDCLYENAVGYDPINRASALELQTYMLSTLLRDTDQMSMAHALEVRVPLLDHELVETVFRLPGACKLHDNHPKPLLSQALGQLLPHECIYRSKQGFAFPFDIWLRQHIGQELAQSFQQQQEADTYPFRPESLANLWKHFTQGRIGWSRIWGIYVLRHWLHAHNVTPCEQAEYGLRFPIYGLE